MLLPFLWLPLLWLQVENRSPEVEWSEVPVFSAERLESAGPSWMAVDGWKTSRPRVDDVRNPLLVAVTVTNFEGFYGRWVELRLRSSAGEGVEAEVGACWATDVGPPFSGTYRDLHGWLRLQTRAAPNAPMLAFRLHGIETSFKEARPVVLEGVVELSSPAPSWLASALVPLEPVEEALDADLREVSSARPDGTLRSRGRVDAAGRRQGRWTTWYANGVKETEATYRNAEREGEWMSFYPGGAPFESGRLKDGFRGGPWVEHSYITTRTGTFAFTASGPYLAGKKHGIWLEHWDNGQPKSREAYENGSPVGLWANWNVDGTLRGFRIREREAN